MISTSVNWVDIFSKFWSSSSLPRIHSLPGGIMTASSLMSERSTGASLALAAGHIPLVKPLDGR